MIVSFLLFFVIIVLQVDTVKRLVIRKLPHILAIQLKRFDYDWERFVHNMSLYFYCVYVIIVGLVGC